MTTKECQICRHGSGRKGTLIQLRHMFLTDNDYLLCCGCRRHYRRSKLQKSLLFAAATIAAVGMLVCSKFLNAPFAIKYACNILLSCAFVAVDIGVLHWIPWQEEVNRDLSGSVFHINDCPYCEGGCSSWRQTLSWNGRRFRGPDTIVCISCGHRYVHSYLQKTLLALCRIISWLLGLFLLTYSVSVKQLPLLLLVIVEGIMESYLEYLIIKWLPWKEGTSW